MKYSWVIAVALIGVLGLWQYYAMAPKAVAPQGGQAMLPTKKISIGKNDLVVEVASTPEQKMHGLSGRSSLAEGLGMLFVFDAPTHDGFWMKDMLLPLDIVWANSSGTIVTIHENISPDTYPQSFKSDEPATYVLELPAGYTKAHSIAVGDKIVL